MQIIHQSRGHLETSLCPWSPNFNIMLRDWVLSDTKVLFVWRKSVLKHDMRNSQKQMYYVVTSVLSYGKSEITISFKT